MIVDRSQKGRLVICAVSAIGLFALGTGCANSTGTPAQPSRTASDSGRQAGGSDERLRQLMTERCDILKSIAESIEKQFASGRATPSEWRDARVTLYRAQADLCTDRVARIAVHEEMVDFLRKCEQWAQRSAEAGQTPQVEVDRARVATIEAQIALERLRLGRDQ